MSFKGVYRAIYDYAPQADAELPVTEGDLLYVLENDSDDGWWKAKKKATSEGGDEPIGLVPYNYVEEAQPLGKARTLYEYTRQTDEELSFPEDATLAVYDTSDEDWILVGLNNGYGFVPSNYIEMQDDRPASPETPDAPPPPTLPTRPPAPTATNEPEEDQSYDDAMRSQASPVSPPANTPAAALAGVMAGRAVAPPPQVSSPPPVVPQSPPGRAGDEYEEDVQSPPLPTRPVSHISAPTRSGSAAQHPHTARHFEEEAPGPLRVPGGFHMYNINEMVSVMGKRKKMPTTLGVNLATGTILIAPEKAQDGPTQEWTADKMTHYSREGKHVFLELVRPSKSIDFHAGAADTAEEVLSMLGELAGAVKAAGLHDIIFAGSNSSSHSQRKGTVLYDFMAQGDDEVTVAAGDDVIVVDDTKSDEWWQVRRMKNGKEGVVPSIYIEVTGAIPPPASSSGTNAGLSTVEQNRLDEVRLTKEAMKAAHQSEPQQRSKRESGQDSGSGSRSKSKPDGSKVRTWTDRSRSFSVEAEFLGLKDGKINLHKVNGVKIAVPIAKMSLEDLEYVERATGVSLDEDKPLSNVKKSSKNGHASRSTTSSNNNGKVGASIEPQPQKPEYDWFQFFLECDVAVGVCERYAQLFNKESMDESVLPDVDAGVLRNLGLREGDILKVMRHLDARFARNKKGKDADGEDGGGGLFSGAGGALRNNTRKGRPAPAVQTSDVVDAKAFSGKDDKPAEEIPAESPVNGSAGTKSTSGGFDDDAWDVKPPTKKTEEPSPAPVEAPKPAPPPPTGSMQDLSLLSAPLEPSKTASPQSPQPALPASATPPAPPAQPQNSQPTGATPAFFAANNQAQQQRQRPTPPQTTGGQGSLPMPPGRPLSAPQSAQPSAFAPPPMAPQMTGVMQGRVAPPGQSLEEVNQTHLQQQQLALQQQQQQQYAQMNPQMTGFPGQEQQPVQGFPTGMPPQTTGQFMPSMMAGAQGSGQFSSPIQSQPTGFPGGQFPPQQQQQSPFNPQPTGAGGVNSYLPPSLEPQRTGMPPFQQPQQTSFGGGQPQSQPQPLQPQQTGPAPPVRFGVTGDAKKLGPQATGRRANLSHATPNNPFGF